MSGFRDGSGIRNWRKYKPFAGTCKIEDCEGSGEIKIANRKIAKDIDEYVGRCPKHVQRLLTQMRTTIQQAAPQAMEKISYGIPTFHLNGNLVHFGAAQNHIGFYPTRSGITAFKQELAPYNSSKGAVQFPKDKPLPLALVARMVKFRVKEQLRK